MTMDKEITKFKSQNGNVTYSTKELIQALHTKFDEHAKYNHESHDEIRRRLAEGEGRFGKIEGSIKVRDTFLKIMTPALLSALAGLLYLMLHLHSII